MKPFQVLIRALVAVLALASAVAWSRSLDAQALKDFGGTYMVDCKNSASAKVSVSAASMVFLNGDKRIASNSLETGYSFFSPNPNPKGFLVTLINAGPGGMEMLWHVFQDANGRYLTFVDADAKTAALIGKALASAKFRHCDGAASSVAAPAPPAPPAPLAQPKRSYALHELSAPGILMDGRARAAYYKALGPLRREPWLANLDGPSPQNKLVSVAGTQYILAGACKNHDCFDNSTVLLYSAAQGVVYGKIHQRGKSTLIGAPQPAVAKELERLWRQEFRKNNP